MLKAHTLPFFGTSFAKSKVQNFKKTQPNKFYFYFAVALIISNFLLLISYVYGVNDFASKGYQIKSLQTKLGVLTEENRKINFKVSESRSMASIQSGVSNSNFVQAGAPKFLEVRLSQFTQR